MLALANLPAAYAGPVSCGCYCGAMLPPPCTDDACKKACGYSRSGPAKVLRDEFAEEAARKRREAEALENAEAEKREKEKFESSKSKAVKSLKNAAPGGFGLKGADGGFKLKGPGAAPCAPEEDFQAYLEREQERKTILENLGRHTPAGREAKARADWCKLNLPLPPSPAAAGYCEKKPAYEQRAYDWKIKCAWATALQPARGGEQKVPARRNGPRPAADCLGVYDGAVKSCTRDAPDCVNEAIRVYLRCAGNDGRPAEPPEGK